METSIPRTVQECMLQPDFDDARIVMLESLQAAYGDGLQLDEGEGEALVRARYGSMYPALDGTQIAEKSAHINVKIHDAQWIREDEERHRCIDMGWYFSMRAFRCLSVEQKQSVLRYAYALRQQDLQMRLQLCKNQTSLMVSRHIYKLNKWYQEAIRACNDV